MMYQRAIISFYSVTGLNGCPRQGEQRLHDPAKRLSIPKKNIPSTDVMITT